MSDFEELARRVEHLWAEESRNALKRDQDRLRRLVDGAMASRRAGAGLARALPTWLKGVGLSAVAVAAGSVGVAVYDGGPGVSAVARVDLQAPPALAPAASPAPPQPPSATVEVETIAVTALPSAGSSGPEASPSTARPSTLRSGVSRAARVEAPAPRKDLSPAELFARANEKRRRSDLRAAESDYHLLMDQAPSSREALLSHVILGHMLEDREPVAALALFERYLDLAGGGALAEEARTSRARLLSKLGRPGEAASAWRELLDRHPDTVHRSEAEAALRSTERNRE